MQNDSFVQLFIIRQKMRINTWSLRDFKPIGSNQIYSDLYPPPPYENAEHVTTREFKQLINEQFLDFIRNLCKISDGQGKTIELSGFHDRGTPESIYLFWFIFIFKGIEFEIK